MADTGVLIIGAGPTGLALACDLAWRGVSAVVVDSGQGPSVHSKALGVMPRTLEQLENHGVVEEMIDRGLRMEVAEMNVPGRRLSTMDMTLGDSAYRYVLVLPQSDTERILLSRLSSLGSEVSWGLEATGLEQTADGVTVTLTSQSGAPRRIQAEWVVGCDGAGSFVREAVGAPFKGERYREAFNLTDVGLRWDRDDCHAQGFLSPDGVLVAIPMAGEHRFRLIADEPSGSAEEEHADPDAAAVAGWLAERAGMGQTADAAVDEVFWSSRFKIARRMVPQMRYGRVFLAGDAAHIHSPAGAQGMNAGIQDAINLAWKLALVVAGGASEQLLDSYSAERIPVARAVLSATHRLTGVATLRNPVATAVRSALAATVLSREGVQRRLMTALTGLSFNYRGSPIVSPRLPPGIPAWLRPDAPPRPGDRAPDHLTDQAGRRMYEHFRHTGHTLLLFADQNRLAEARVVRTLVNDRVGHAVKALIVSERDPGDSRSGGWLRDTGRAISKRYGGDRTPVVLVRPDRHIGLMSDVQEADRVVGHLESMLHIGR